GSGAGEGAAGVAAKLAAARTRGQLEWLADEVIEAGGQAGVWLARPSTAHQERELAAQSAAARAIEYTELASAATSAIDLNASARTSALRRLRGQWRQIAHRDFFPPPERERAASALPALSSTTEQVPTGQDQEVSPF